MKAGNKTLQQSLLAICGIGVLLWPILFLLIRWVAEFAGAELYINEMGIIKFSLTMLSLSLFLPMVEYLVERYF